MLRMCPKRNSKHGRLDGNAMVAALVIMVLMVGLSSAQYVVVQKNTQQSRFVAAYKDLSSYADSAAMLALHDLRYEVTGDGGNVGTAAWRTANDVGEDGIAGTGDRGEGDGIPTPGEPNLTAANLGPAATGFQLLVNVQDTAWPDVKRIVSSTFTSEEEATVKMYVRKRVITIPKWATMYVGPGSVLDVNGSAYQVIGHDTNVDGTSGPEADVWALATDPGTPAGDNESALTDQIPNSQNRQFDGAGPPPSVGETPEPLDIDGLAEAFIPLKSSTLGAGTHNDVDLGSPSNYKVTYANGEGDVVRIAGNQEGYGILVVDGPLHLTGTLDFHGLIVVRGDLKITGDVRTYGSVMVRDSAGFIDPTLRDSTVRGSAELYFSSEALANVENMLGQINYSVVYWDQLQ